MSKPTPPESDPPKDLAHLLRELEQLEAQAPDEETRREVHKLRAELDTPEMREMDARLKDASADLKKRRPTTLRFDDPVIPRWITLPGCALASVCTLVTLMAAFRMDSPTEFLYMPAIFAVAAVAFFLLSRLRRFTVTCDPQQISCQAFGSRWASLRVGTMRTSDLRSVRERTHDGVLELHGEGGMLEVPMRVTQYEILHRLLSRFARPGLPTLPR